MNRKIYIAVAAAAVIAAVFCIFGGKHGRGEIITKNFTITSPGRVSKIATADNFTLIVTNDVPYGVVEVTTYENIMEAVAVKSSEDGRTLNIGVLDGVNIKSSTNLVAKIRPIATVRQFEATKATIEIATPLRLNSCEIELNEKATFAGYNLTSNNITANIDNRSKMEISTTKTPAIKGFANNKSTLKYKGEVMNKATSTLRTYNNSKVEFVTE